MSIGTRSDAHWQANTADDAAYSDVGVAEFALPRPMVVFGLSVAKRSLILEDLYGDVEDLLVRYGVLVGRLRREWWLRDGEVEMLAALAAERRRLDLEAVTKLGGKNQMLFLLGLETVADFLSSREGLGAFEPIRDKPAFRAYLEGLDDATLTTSTDDGGGVRA